MARDLRDPRRAGFVAAAFAGAYIASLIVSESLTFRVAFGVATFALGTVFVMLVPLPPWRESEDRKRRAAVIIVGESLLLMALATVVRWLI